MREYVSLDLETTGLEPKKDRIIEIGAAKIRDGEVQETYSLLVDPRIKIPERITDLTGINNQMVEGQPFVEEAVGGLLEFCEELPLLGHNLMFDYSFVKCSAVQDGLSFEKMGIDTLKIAKKVHADMESKSLGSLCSHYHIENKSAHRAYHDALATAKLYQTLAHYFEKADPKLFKPVQLTYKVKKPQSATPKQISFLRSLIQKRGVKMEWDPENLTRSEASRMIDNLLKG